MVACEAATLSAATAASLLNVPETGGPEGSAAFVSVFFSVVFDSETLPTALTLLAFYGAADADAAATGAPASGVAVADATAVADAFALGDTGAEDAGALADKSADAVGGASCDANLSATTAPAVPTMAMPTTMPTMTPILLRRCGT
jgi:hypothetical protein